MIEEENIEDYQNFLSKLQKRGSNPYSIKNCLGSRDAWKGIRKNKWKTLGNVPFDQGLYSKIISTVNKYIVERVLEGHEVELPHKMGSILLGKRRTSVFFENGECKSTYITDWIKTLEYWYKDEEARNKHQKIKVITDYLFNVRYCKKRANYTNKRFYLFRPNRSLLKRLGKQADKEKILAEETVYYY